MWRLYLIETKAHLDVEKDEDEEGEEEEDDRGELVQRVALQHIEEGIIYRREGKCRCCLGGRN